MQTIKPVKEGIFTVEPKPSLIGAKCPTCNKNFFPKPLVCTNCLGEVEEVHLATEGTIYTYAILSTKPPYGLPSPYAVGWVDLEQDGLRIFSLLDPKDVNEIEIGKKVTLKIEQIGVDNDNEPCLRYYFALKEGSDNE